MAFKGWAREKFIKANEKHKSDRKRREAGRIQVLEAKGLQNLRNQEDFWFENGDKIVRIFLFTSKNHLNFRKATRRTRKINRNQELGKTAIHKTGRNLAKALEIK